jgi:hypothetical protein
MVDFKKKIMVAWEEMQAAWEAMDVAGLEAKGKEETNEIKLATKRCQPGPDDSIWEETVIDKIDDEIK